MSDFCTRLNTSFSNICERLNRLGETVDNARTRQKEVIELVDQTKNTFEEKNLSVSDKIGDSLKQSKGIKLIFWLIFFYLYLVYAYFVLYLH